MTKSKKFDYVLGREANRGHNTDLPDSTGRRYLGIDPGLRCTGYAVLERSADGPILREGGVIRSTTKLSLAERVHEIGSGLREVFVEYRPGVVAIEQVFSLVKNPKSALLMAHARGAILMICTDLGIPVVHYTPTNIKRLLTGNGQASKVQIQYAIKNELGLARVLEPNDVADAFAVALCHYHSIRIERQNDHQSNRKAGRVKRDRSDAGGRRVRV